jgi:LysR family cys regulon transcriptional activator
VPKDHPLTQVSPLTLEAIARWPLITYRQGITGRSRIDEAFNRKGLMPDIVLSAQDSDVIKTYVELGLGVGLVPSSPEMPGKRTPLRVSIPAICSMPIPCGWG